MNIIPRKAEKTLRQLSGDYKILVITGPRQSGKSTIVKKVFSENLIFL